MAATWHNAASRLNQTLARNISQHIQKQNFNAKQKIMHWKV